MEQLKIKLNTLAPVGDTSELEIDFSGTFEDKIVGFYLSTYKDEQKVDR
jgi:hypothetical protein